MTTRTLPLGWYRADVSGTQSHGLSLLRETVWSGKVSGIAGASDVAIAPSLTANPSGELYLEVLDGALVGHRFNVAAANSSVDRLRIDASSANNTRSSFGGALVDARVALRRHWTLGEAFPAVLFSGGATAGVSDRVQIFDSSTSSYITYYLHQGIKWVADGDTTLADQGGVVLAPGSGTFVTRTQDGTVSLTHRGEVRANPFRSAIAPGQHLRGRAVSGFPVAVPASAHQFGSFHRIFGSRWLPTACRYGNGSAFTRYYLWEDWPTAYWRRIGSTVNQNNAKLFDFRHGTFITTRWGYHPNYTVPVPWTP